MKTYFDCWTDVAAALFSQALAGEPELVESLPKPLGGGAFGWAATLSGDIKGRFSILLDAAVLERPLVGEGMDQKAGWKEILRETIDAACGELLAQTGEKCRVDSFEEIDCEGQISHAFQLRSGEHAWPVLVRDDTHIAESQVDAQSGTVASAPSGPQADAKVQSATGAGASCSATGEPELRTGLELLLDVELEAALRFGSREMPLGEILDLGPGDVVELDRLVSDPVDLIVSDKIVARGEVVLVNGNFGLRVTEVAVPKKRLESIRCLF